MPPPANSDTVVNNTATPEFEAPKIGDTVRVADWFSFDLPGYAISPKWVRIIGESQSGKAWKVDIDTETVDGERDLYYTKFIPKAAVKTREAVDYENQQAENRFNQGVEKYNKMLEYAKKMGVKGVREGLRKETILKKMKDAGIEYDYSKGALKPPTPTKATSVNTKLPRVGAKVHDAYIAFVKQQVKVDLSKARDTTFDNRNGFNIDTRRLDRNDLFKVKDLARKSYGDFNVEIVDNGANRLYIKVARKKN